MLLLAVLFTSLGLPLWAAGGGVVRQVRADSKQGGGGEQGCVAAEHEHGTCPQTNGNAANNKQPHTHTQSHTPAIFGNDSVTVLVSVTPNTHTHTEAHRRVSVRLVPPDNRAGTKGL